jgi:Trypsin-co-occurring domain 2
MLGGRKNHWTGGAVTDTGHAPAPSALAPGIGLDEAIEALREQLAAAHAKAAGADLQFPVESVTVELRVVVTRSLEAKAGLRFSLLGAQLGGSGSRERETGQTVTLVLGGPLNRDGVPQRVARASDEIKG